jgi:hypothetical protein
LTLVTASAAKWSPIVELTHLVAMNAMLVVIQATRINRTKLLQAKFPLFVRSAMLTTEETGASQTHRRNAELDWPFQRFAMVHTFTCAIAVVFQSITEKIFQFTSKALMVDDI